MNKVFVVIVFSVFYTHVFGQTLEGGSILGGGIELAASGMKITHDTSTKYYNEYIKTRYILIAPQYALFVRKNLAIGLSLNFMYMHSDTESQFYETNKSNEYMYGLGPFVKKFIPLNSNLYLFVLGGYSINYDLMKTHYLRSREVAVETKAQGINHKARAALGFTYFVSQDIGLETFIGLSSTFAQTTISSVETTYTPLTSYESNRNEDIKEARGIVVGLGGGIVIHLMPKRYRY